MLRLSVLLCAFLAVTLLIAGRDGGQLRPGLARAAAEGKPVIVVAHSFSAGLDGFGLAAKSAKTTPSNGEKPKKIAILQTRPTNPTPPEKPMTPAFTLSSLPDLNGEKAALPSNLPSNLPEYLPAAQGFTQGYSQDHAYVDDGQTLSENGLLRQVWRVDARAVNLRLGPSTKHDVADKLDIGQAVLVLGPPNEGWVQVVTEGDGIEGWVAARFLSPL